MRLPSSAHKGHGWVIEEIAADFKLLDVWALPAEGGRDDFPALLEIMASFDPAAGGSLASRVLFKARLVAGRWLGWDDATVDRPIPGCTETRLSARLPEHLAGSAGGTKEAAAFEPVYRTGDEWAAEISNATVHGVLHVGWVEEGEGRFRGQLGIYVKARGVAGEVYLKVIEPFRHHVVYPSLMRELGRAWDARTS